MTISAFQGFGALRSPLDIAARYGKGLFVLAATSNPEALAVQTAVIQREAQAGKSLAGGLASRVVNWNRTHSEGPIGSIGVVLGATVDFADFGINLAELAESPAAPILAPGFGYQGAQFADVKRLFGVAAATTIVTASRSILAAGPAGLGDAIARQAELLGEAIA
jgi:orotidine-5'-phosphate decarboxylase